MIMSGVRMLASSPMLMFLLSLLMASFFDTTAGQIGVCYGEMGNNLPSNAEVVRMYQANKITRMRMYGANPNALNALRGSNIELILDVSNPEIIDIANNQANANMWVQNNVKKYSNDVRFRYISVGNEVKPEYPYGKGTILIRAIQNIDKALSDAGLSIPVSTTTYMGAFMDTFPPSHGRFNDTYLDFLKLVIDFLVSKRSPLLVNIYTFFPYNDANGRIPLEYALLTQTAGGNPDGPHTYRNLFDASLDSVYASLEKLGAGSLEVVVSESGWPTRGGLNANADNAAIYVNNLIQHVKNGSPKRPGKPIETYIFAMFNEDKKGPQEYERFWGLFFPDKRPQLMNIKFN